MLAQIGPTYQAALGRPQDMDALLEAIAPYKNRCGRLAATWRVSLLIKPCSCVHHCTTSPPPHACTMGLVHRDPGTELEEEFVDNLFDVVCAALVDDRNKPQFVDSEGVELMLLMLKNKRYARAGALKTLDFACTQYVKLVAPA